MAIETIPYDGAEFFESTDAQAELLADALGTGNAPYIASALSTIARARGMSNVARQAGITRAALYRALGPDGNPRLSTLLGIVRALGFTLSLDRSDKAA